MQRTPHAAFGLDLDPVLVIREQPGVREDFDVERGDPVKIIDAIGMDRLFRSSDRTIMITLLPCSPR